MCRHKHWGVREKGLNYWVWRVAQAQPAALLCSAQTSYAQSIQLQLQAPSGDTVPAQGGLPITQLLRILNPNKVSPEAPRDKTQRREKSQVLTLVSALLFLGPLAAKIAPYLQPLRAVGAGDL